MKHILDHDVAALAPELLAEIDRLAPAYAAVSPSAHARNIRVPVFVLHGAGDILIPPSEAEWLAHDIPPSQLHAALVSPAIEHVGLEDHTSLADELSLVHFMSDVLEQTESEL
jgi:pimeloyl-ACP methyl ester carboxylesterase